MIKLESKFLLSKNLDKIKDKKVLVRSDLNVPIHGLKRKNFDGNYRIKIVKDIIGVLKPAKQIILISHFARPKNADKRGFQRELTRINQKYSLKKFVRYFPKFRFFQWEPGLTLPDNKYLLLENLRFFQEEEKCDLRFAKSLSGLADIFINEAFSVSHRVHASVVGIPKFLSSYFGINFEKEIKNLNRVFEIKKGLAIMIGGVKIETKLPLLKKFIDKADLIILAGLVAKEFYPHTKFGMGVKKILTPEKVGMDTETETVKLFLEKLKLMKLIVWNGPFGKIEDKKFEAGTLLLAKKLAAMKNFRIVGGGDTISFLYKHKLQNKFDFISSGGGALLDYLAKETLPGIEAIQK
jgi:phosphoglycerate kinase